MRVFNIRAPKRKKVNMNNQSNQSDHSDESEVPGATKKTKRPGFLSRVFGPGAFLREQKELAFGKRHRVVWADAAKEVSRVKNLHKAPRVVETFEEAVVRHNLTQEVLDERYRQFHRAHLALYVIGILLLEYAVYLSFNVGAISATGAFVAAVGAFVNGYLNGFRAWQVSHRNLIQLQDALRIPSTYLLL